MIKQNIANLKSWRNTTKVLQSQDHEISFNSSEVIKNSNTNGIRTATLAKKILKTAFILIALRFLWFSMQHSTHSQTAGSLKNHQYKSKNLLQKKNKKNYFSFCKRQQSWISLTVPFINFARHEGISLSNNTLMIFNTTPDMVKLRLSLRNGHVSKIM